MQVKKNSKKIKEENLNKIKHNNMHGITLIALVITIIVLIILAGVSINLVLGDNGIITKAKEAKTETEQAKIDEERSLAEALEYIDTLGEGRTIEEVRNQGYVKVKTIVRDTLGNKFIIPEGFKIAEDSGDNITEGIVIEDNDVKIDGNGNNRGNQYVWIPVGTGINKSKTEAIDITLGRYDFADGKNDMAEDGVTPLTKGTPILVQNINDYTNQTNYIKIDTYFYEDITQRIGEVNTDNHLKDKNTTALSISDFKTSVENNGGYYIARYEASYGFYGADTTAKAKSKVSKTYTDSSIVPTTRTEGMLWNHITQIDAATASRNLYTTVNSDLINSYAWDTAIVYIQKFSEDTDYSRQDGKSINASLTNTGENKDEVCKINDMASNTLEWTTEYSTNSDGSIAYPCTLRGGYYYSTYNYTSFRYSISATDSFKNTTFRSVLYM